MGDSEIIKEINSLDKELKSLLPMSTEQNEILDKKFRLEFHYNSNHLEGNTLTYAETELLFLFEETRGNHTFREYEEMRASEVAFNLVQREASEKDKPLTEAFIKNLNKVLLVEPYWKEAVTPDGQNTRRKILVGDYKKNPNSVILQNGEIFNYASPAETPILMGELIDWYRDESQKGKLHPIELASQLHYRFVRIHPFDDGNGRISRLLMNYVLFSYDLPPIVIKSNEKANYLAALHDADVGLFESFDNYIAEQLVWSLQLAIKAAKNEPIEEKEDWKKKVTLLKKKLETHEAVKITKSTEVIYALINDKINNYLHKCLEKLTDLDDLFLEKMITRDSVSKQSIRWDKGVLIGEEIIKQYFYQSFEVKLWFSEFTKNPDNPFSVYCKVEFQFEKHKFNVKLDGDLLFYKLYHQNFSDIEIEQMENAIGAGVYEEIEERLARAR